MKGSKVLTQTKEGHFLGETIDDNEMAIKTIGFQFDGFGAVA